MSVPCCVSSPETTVERLAEARRLSSDLLVQFTKAADAANRAVMADTDEASREFAREAEAASASVQKNSATLRQILMDLRYATEAGLLDEFAKQFSAYRMLDQSILSLAVENTNLKAQRLSFGSAQQAADAFRDAVDAVKGSASTKGRSRVDALATTAVFGCARDSSAAGTAHRGSGR
jgi:hypothetical protein